METNAILYNIATFGLGAVVSLIVYIWLDSRKQYDKKFDSINNSIEQLRSEMGQFLKISDFNTHLQELRTAIEGIAQRLDQISNSFVRVDTCKLRSGQIESTIETLQKHNEDRDKQLLETLNNLTQKVDDLYKIVYTQMKSKTGLHVSPFHNPTGPYGTPGTGPYTPPKDNG